MSEKVLHKARLLLFLSLCVLTIVLTACYPVTRSKGNVKNEQGQPIADAVVKIGGKSAKPAETKTNSEGKFDFGDVQIISHQNPLEIELTVEKEGFSKFNKLLIFNAENSDEIVLQK